MRELHHYDLIESEKRLLADLADEPAIAWQSRWRRRGSVRTYSDMILARLVGMRLAETATIRGAKAVIVSADGRRILAEMRQRERMRAA